MYFLPNKKLQKGVESFTQLWFIYLIAFFQLYFVPSCPTTYGMYKPYFCLAKRHSHLSKWILLSSKYILKLYILNSNKDVISPKMFSFWLNMDFWWLCLFLIKKGMSVLLICLKEEMIQFFLKFKGKMTHFGQNNSGNHYMMGGEISQFFLLMLQYLDS